MMILATSIYRQLVRERYVHAVFWIALLFFLLCLPLGSLSFEEQERVLFHFGLLAVHWTLLGLALVIGCGRLSQDLERQSLFLLLARPLSRGQLYFSQWLGQGLLLGTIGGLLLLVLDLLLRFVVGLHLSALIELQIFTGILTEALVLMALGMFFSLFVRPAVSFFASFGVFLFGNWLPDLQYFAEKSKDPLWMGFAKFVPWIFPQLYRLNWRSLDIAKRELLTWNDWSISIFHGSSWIFLLLAVGVFSFRRKDLV